MTLKFNLRQIAENEWEKGDFRPVADIHKTMNELFAGNDFKFSEYFEENLGCKYKVAFFQTPSNRRFFVVEYNNVHSPPTKIFVLFDQKTIKHDLDEIKSLLHLNDAELNLIYKYQF